MVCCLWTGQAHSIGSNFMFKVSKTVERELKIVAVAPMEKFLGWHERMHKVEMRRSSQVLSQIVPQLAKQIIPL